MDPASARSWVAGAPRYNAGLRGTQAELAEMDKRLLALEEEYNRAVQQQQDVAGEVDDCEVSGSAGRPQRRVLQFCEFVFRGFWRRVFVLQPP